VKKAESKFYYNPKTLRYERVRISIFNISVTFLSLALFGFAFFVGLVFLQNYLIQSPLERALREENEALKTHQTILASRLEAGNGLLSELKERDRLFYAEIFSTERDSETGVDPDQDEILLAGIPEFHGWADKLGEKLKTASKNAYAWDYIFRQKASVRKEDLKMLKSAPTMVPMEDFEVEKLVSGFGIRINPFHKGKYQHSGVDLAAPSGSRVLAGGPGRVIMISNNNLVAGYGNYIEIDHGYGYITRYAHLRDILVHYGQTIKEGQPIGTVGMSGGVIAPHLHYEVLKDGEKMDPVRFMLSGLTTAKYDLMVKAGKKMNQSLD